MQHSEYKFRLTLSQCPTASGCSETAGACWQQSPTSLSTWPTHSWSTQQGILLIKKEKIVEEKSTQAPGCVTASGRESTDRWLCLCFVWFLCVYACVFWPSVFVLVSGARSQVTSSTSQRMRKLHRWYAGCEREERFFFLLLHCHTMIWQSKMTHDVTEKNEWDCVGIIWLLTTWKVDPPLQTDISWGIICAALRLFVASCN